MPRANKLKNLSGKSDFEFKDIGCKETDDGLFIFSDTNRCPYIRYAMSGGLRLRFEVLYRAATTLSRLHSLSLVYGDVSAKNLFFIADDDQRATVWFIDADNISFEIKKPSGLFTPGYGAPEVVQRADGCRPVSDCWAFAVLAFNIICWNPPFEGNLLKNDDDDNWGNSSGDPKELSKDEKALRGEIPFIVDPDDKSNSEDVTNRAFPRNILLGSDLSLLFKKMFCEGRKYAGNRPSIYHFMRAFAKARDCTVNCPNCGFSLRWNFDYQQYKCLLCDSVMNKKHLLAFETYTFDNKISEKPVWQWVREFSFDDDTNFDIPERVFTSFDSRRSSESAISFIFKSQKNFCSIQKNLATEIRLAWASENNRRFVNMSEIGVILDFNQLEKPKAVWLRSINKFGQVFLVNVRLVRGNVHASV
jgi:serine/threonine protein kinase